MPLPASNPTTTPAQPARTYGHWWLKGLQLSAPAPLRPAAALVTLQKYADDGTLSPLPGDTLTLPLADILSPAMQSKYPQLAAAVGAVLTAVLAIGTDLGKL
jgi:hypothetical protein